MPSFETPSRKGFLIGRLARLPLLLDANIVFFLSFLRPGTLVLGHALRALHPRSTHAIPFKLVCIVTPETVDAASIKALSDVWDTVVGVEVLEHVDQDKGLGLLGQCVVFVFRVYRARHLFAWLIISEISTERSMLNLSFVPLLFIQVVGISTPSLPSCMSSG